MRGLLEAYGANTLSLLRNTLLVPILIILSNCAYAPDPLPGGAPGVAHYPGVRAAIGKSDLAVIITVKHSEKHDLQDVIFNWDRKGSLIWGERPGNTAAIWRFVLIAPGVEKPLCQTPWKKSEDTSVTCNFKAEDYLTWPLIGEIDFWLDGENPGNQLNGEEPGKDEPLYRIASRIHYLVEDPAALMKQ